MKIWSLYIIQLVPLERGLLNGMTQCLYWIVIMRHNIYLLSIWLYWASAKINVLLHNGGISLTPTYSAPSFGCDIIMSAYQSVKS